MLLIAQVQTPLKNITETEKNPTRLHYMEFVLSLLTLMNNKFNSASISFTYKKRNAYTFLSVPFHIINSGASEQSESVRVGRVPSYIEWILNSPAALNDLQNTL